ncbi:hypothetical protein B9473_012330 [Klebsiella quasipneumoniae subsp. quasipneumoniae]|nr:hypothetical protein B9473_012330 [Klebsiella quasipneumoniae subsp. quasipneumoniae]
MHYPVARQVSDFLNSLRFTKLLLWVSCNVRLWHRADVLTKLKVRWERGVEVCNSHNYVTNIEVS